MRLYNIYIYILIFILMIIIIFFNINWKRQNFCSKFIIYNKRYNKFNNIKIFYIQFLYEIFILNNMYYIHI